MKRRILSLVSLALLAATMLVSCSEKEGLQYSLDGSLWQGNFVLEDYEMVPNEEGTQDALPFNDTIYSSIAFNKTHCRWTCKVMRSSVIEGGESTPMLSFDYYGTYDYEEGKGTFYSDATVLNGGEPFAFSVPNAETLTFPYLDSLFSFNRNFDDVTVLNHRQISNLEY